MMYYVCTYDGYKPIAGPYNWPNQAADVVMAQADPTQFCTMSRYMLAKHGIYPNTKLGNARLESDLEENRKR